MGRLLQGDDDSASLSRVVLVIVFSAIIMIFWQVFYEPKLRKPVEKKNEKVKNESVVQIQKEEPVSLISRTEALLFDKKNVVFFENDFISGRINRVGAVVDSLIFKNYKYKIDNGKDFFLLSPKNTKYERYIAFGWVSSFESIVDLPNSKTIWDDNGGDIVSEGGKTLFWKNKDNVRFFLNFSFDTKYMLTVRSWIINNGKNNISLAPYTKIEKDITIKDEDKNSQSGAILLNQNSVKELDYSKISKESIDYVEDGKHCIAGQHNWAGFSDKYWLSAVMFGCGDIQRVSLKLYEKSGRKHIHADILENFINIQQSQRSDERKIMVYLGPKDISLLDDYSSKYNIKLFDKSIDFGLFYFLTKPILLMLRFINGFVKNYGIAIILLTIIIRTAMIPLSNKSYKMIERMKDIKPKLDALKERFGEDKKAMNMAMIDLYRAEKVNPFATFIPILIQIPIFFALYKVLYISIEIRQSPFIFWIKDLSAPDPLTVFNLFDLLPFNPPSFLHIGILPILVGFTMWLQQKMSYSGPETEYSKVMKYMPIFFTFLFASFPAGLMIYWTVNNLFSIINQLVISHLNSRAK